MTGTSTRKTRFEKGRVGSCFVILVLLFTVGCGGGGGGGGGVAAAPNESLAVSEAHAIFSQQYFEPGAVRGPAPGETVQHYVDSYRSPLDIYSGYLDPQELADLRNDIETPENLIQRVYGTTQYVCFEKFVSGTADRVIEAIEANTAFCTTLVLDLRINTGGLPGEVEKLANYFMGSLGGPAPFFFIEGPALNLTSMLPLTEPGNITENTFDASTMMILTSGLTASAAEILVAGLVHYGEAIQLGSTTFGKNRVINVFSDPERGDGFYITTGIVWHANQLDSLGQPLPGESDREGIGLTPEVGFLTGEPFGLAATQFGFTASDPLTTDWNVSTTALANLYNPSFWRDQVYMAAGLAPAERILRLPEFMNVPGPDPMPLP